MHKATVRSQVNLLPGQHSWDALAGARLRDLMEARGVTAAAICEATGLHRNTVYVVSVAHRSPGSAGLLSGLIVGAGQAYNGEWGKGLAFLGAEVLLLAGHSNAWDGCGLRGDCEKADVLLGAMAAVWLVNIVDAVRSAKRLNAQGVSVAPSVGPGGQVGFFVRVRAP